jgi:hypothetical protein
LNFDSRKKKLFVAFLDMNICERLFQRQIGFKSFRSGAPLYGGRPKFRIALAEADCVYLGFLKANAHILLAYSVQIVDNGMGNESKASFRLHCVHFEFNCVRPRFTSIGAVELFSHILALDSAENVNYSDTWTRNSERENVTLSRDISIGASGTLCWRLTVVESADERVLVVHVSPLGTNNASDWRQDAAPRRNHVTLMPSPAYFDFVCASHFAYVCAPPFPRFRGTLSLVESRWLVVNQGCALRVFDLDVCVAAKLGAARWTTRAVPMAWGAGDVAIDVDALVQFVDAPGQRVATPATASDNRRRVVVARRQSLFDAGAFIARLQATVPALSRTCLLEYDLSVVSLHNDEALVLLVALFRPAALSPLTPTAESLRTRQLRCTLLLTLRLANGRVHVIDRHLNVVDAVAANIAAFAGALATSLRRQHFVPSSRARSQFVWSHSPTDASREFLLHPQWPIVFVKTR